MLDWMLQHPEWGTFLVVGFGSVFGFCARQVWRLYRAFTDHFDSVAVIKKQVLPNKGTSMRDDVTRLSTHIKAMSHRGALVEAIVRSSSWDTSTVAQFLTNEEGDCVDVNRAFIDLTGRGMDQMGGGSGINVVCSFDRARIAEAWECAVADQRDFEEEYSIQTRTGIALVRCRAMANFDKAADGKPFIGHAGRYMIMKQT